MSRLWFSNERSRFFLLPDAWEFEDGGYFVRDMLGSRASTTEQSILSFEVTEEHARRWASSELGDALTELRHGIDEKLAEARMALEEFKSTPIETKSSDTAKLNADAGPALLDFLKSLPGVIGQSISGDQQRVDTARDTLTRLQQRLRESGIDVDDRMKGFADRLASIRTDADKPEEKS